MHEQILNRISCKKNKRERKREKEGEKKNELSQNYDVDSLERNQ